MSPTLYSFIGITLTLVVLLLWSIKDNHEGWMVTFSLTLVVFGIFGWGVFLSTTTDVVKVDYKQAKVLEILKGKHITVVSTSGNYNRVYSGYGADIIDSTTIFKWKLTYKYNYYGYEIGYDTEFIAENDTIKNAIPKIKLAR